jgi:hypothetical protein
MRFAIWFVFAILVIGVLPAGADPTPVPTANLTCMWCVIQPTLVAKFIGTPLIGDPPITVQFTDLSYDIPHTTEWNFGDGSTKSTATNPSHTYTDAGLYDVTLVVTGTGDDWDVHAKFTSHAMVYAQADVTPLPTTTFGAQADDMRKSNSNITKYGEILPTAYSNAMGSAGLYLFFGLFLGFIFMAMFARMGDTLMLAIYGITVGGIVTTTGMLTSFIPVEFQRVSQGFLILCIAGLLYSLWRGR